MIEVIKFGPFFFMGLWVVSSKIPLKGIK